jgi:hypothetical protein
MQATMTPFQSVASANEAYAPSSPMATFIQLMSSSWTAVESFLTDPAQVIAQSKLTGSERDAVLARDVKALVSIGWDADLAFESMSGGHSSGCNTTR